MLFFGPVCGVAFVLAACSTSVTLTEYRAGSQAAAVEIVQGRLNRLDNHGIVRAGTLELGEILQREYGIGSVRKDVSNAYALGYNEAMSAAAEEKFGSDYYAMALRELEAGGGGLSGLFLEHRP